MTSCPSKLLSNHEIVQLLDEEMTEEEEQDLRDAEAVCKRFLQWDLDDKDGKGVKERLKEVLGLTEDE